MSVERKTGRFLFLSKRLTIVHGFRSENKISIMPDNDFIGKGI